MIGVYQVHEDVRKKYTQAELDAAVREAREKALDVVLRIITDEKYFRLCTVLSELPEDQLNIVKEILKISRK